MTTNIVTSPSGNFWSPAFAILEEYNDYIEWTFTMDADTAARANNSALAMGAGVRKSGPFFADLGSNGYGTPIIYVNGMAGGTGVGGPSGPVGIPDTNSTYNRFENVMDTGAGFMGHYFFTEGINTVRIANNPYKVGTPGHTSNPIHVDFVWFDDSLASYGGYYPFSGTTRGASAPGYFASHSNPAAFNNATETEPFLIFKASDGVGGTQAGTSVSVTQAGNIDGGVDLTIHVTASEFVINPGDPVPLGYLKVWYYESGNYYIVARNSLNDIGASYSEVVIPVERRFTGTRTYYVNYEGDTGWAPSDSYVNVEAGSTSLDFSYSPDTPGPITFTPFLTTTGALESWTWRVYESDGTTLLQTSSLETPVFNLTTGSYIVAALATISGAPNGTRSKSVTIFTDGSSFPTNGVDFIWSPDPVPNTLQTVTFTDITFDIGPPAGDIWVIGKQGVDFSSVLSGTPISSLATSDVLYGILVAFSDEFGPDINAALFAENGVDLSASPRVIRSVSIADSIDISDPPPLFISDKVFSLKFPTEGFYDVILFRFTDLGTFAVQGGQYKRVTVGNFVGNRTILFDNIVVTNAGAQFPTDGTTGPGSGTVIPGQHPDIPPGYYQFWRPEDVYNNRNELTMKWLVCDAGAILHDTADGTGYRTCPLDNEDYERGWWSQNRSDSAGNFTTPEWVQSQWTTPRLVNRIQLNLMYGYAPMNSVGIEYLTADGQWVQLATPNFITAFNPEDFIWTYDFSSAIEISGLRATVYSTTRPNDWARLSELNAFYIVDISEDVISIDIKEDMEFYESNVAIPRTAAKSVDITFNNISEKYKLFAPYTGYVLGANTRFSIYLSQLNNDTLVMDEVYFGDYYSDSWSNDSSSMTASVQCRDASKFLQDQMTYWNKVWKDTLIDAPLIEILLLNDIPLRRININGNNTTINQVYLKQSTPWELFGELALVSFSMFRFTRDNIFEYDDFSSSVSKDKLLDYSTNIISANMQTEVYANKITVKVNPIIKEENKLTSLWAAPSPTILSWSALGANINAESSTITVATAPRQSGFNLTNYGWPDRGYLFLYELAYEIRGGRPYPMVINGEVVKYNSRTDSAFTDIERGALYTAAQDWTAGTKIGELVMFNMEFSNAPVEDIRFPFVTAIDVLSYDDIEATKQAHVVLWEHDQASGRLAIANIADYYTWLAGTGQTARDIDDTEHDIEIEFATAVAGVALVQVQSEVITETIINPEKTLANLVRRYGKNEIKIDSPFIQTREAAETILDRMIARFQYPVPEWKVKTTAILDLDLKDKILFGYLDGFNFSTERSVVVIGNTIRYDGGIDQEIRVRRDLD